MIRKIKDTDLQKKKEKSNVTGIKEVKAIKEKIRAIKAGIKELKDDSKKTSKVTTTETKEAKSQKEEKMYVIPLGGLEEVGKNMTVVQYRDEIIIIDSGVTFPDENLFRNRFGNSRFYILENNKDKVKGLFITHGHEDHIGSIPYLYQKIDKTVPMYEEEN